MTLLKRNERNALARMRAAYLDLQSAKRYTEANDLLDLIERIDPPSATDGEAVARAARSEASTFPPSSASPATFRSPGAITVKSPGWNNPCASCGQPMAAHCTTHLLPCCPGSLMHGQDEGTWTPDVSTGI